MKEEIRGRKNAGGKEKLEFSFFFFFLKIFFTYKCLLPMKWSNEHASNDLYFTKAISIIDESSDKKKKFLNALLIHVTYYSDISKYFPSCFSLSPSLNLSNSKFLHINYFQLIVHFLKRNLSKILKYICDVTQRQVRKIFFFFLKL